MDRESCHRRKERSIFQRFKKEREEKEKKRRRKRVSGSE
jgi:hypothetical protein